jgi:hypothetical protein
MKENHAHGKKSRGGKLSHNFGVSIMRRLLLFLLLLGLHSEVLADGRVAITGVPVVGGHRTLYTTPPSEESQYDDYGRPLSVPYPSTHYARNLPSHLTLGQGRIEGKPWYFNSNGYNSYHYGEHYQPTGGLTESYSGYTNSCGNSYSGNYSGGNLRELWIPIDRPREPKMSVVTSAFPVALPAVIDPVPESEVRHVTVKQWNDDGTAFQTIKGSTWKLIAGTSVPLSERNTKPNTQKQIDGYPVIVKHLDGVRQNVFHFVQWDGDQWKHTGQAWEKH